MTVVLVLLCVLLAELSGQNNQSCCLKVPPKGLLKRTQIFFVAVVQKNRQGSQQAWDA